MRRVVTAAVALWFGYLGAIGYAQSEAPTAAQFVGMWRLASRTQRLADGSTRQDPRSDGYISYSDAARMCYVATNPNRPKWKSDTAPTPAEALNAITGLAAYCAAVDIHLAEGFIVHHVEIDRSPNRVGQDLKRWFMFQGQDRLVFRVDASELEAPVVEDVLVWERVRK